MPTVEILVGMIASGKSTYARKRAEEGAVIVEHDAIVKAVHAGRYDLYDDRLKPLYKSAERAMIEMALSQGRDVVIDRTNHTRAMRRRYIGLASSADASVIGVVFENRTAEEHANRRFESDYRGLFLSEWVSVAKQHLKEWERPTLDEGFSALCEQDVKFVDPEPDAASHIESIVDDLFASLLTESKRDAAITPGVWHVSA
jgi:predicted kinase